MEGVCVQYLHTRWFVLEISLVPCAHSFDFRYLTNSCGNTIRTFREVFYIHSLL